jgi:cobalamin biosynthesis Co2+ chelatase CbiK
MKLNQDNSANNMNQEQRQRIFEDVIIQRIRVIQNYVKKNIQRVKDDVSRSGGHMPISQPVILNSIHNDGMSLELKIKDVVKWKLDAFEQKQKAKDDKLMMLEVNLNRQEKKFNDMLTAISDASQQEFDKV